MQQPTILYIGAHDVDFMIRAGGTLMNYARAAAGSSPSA